MKSFLKSYIGRTITAWLFYEYCRFVLLTSKVTFKDRGKVNALYKSGSPLILAFWHGRLVMIPHFFDNKGKTRIIVSKHGDGALIARVMDFFGIEQIRVSSNRTHKDKKGKKDRGGATALRQAITLLKKGNMPAITPDGPKGPRMRVQEGTVTLARLAGAPVLAATFSSSNCKIFKSWDRFLLPLPFGKIIVECSDPIYVPRELDDEGVEMARKNIENQLNNITRLADEQAGIEPVEP